MQNAIAFANNDVITVAWSFGQKLEGCMGFAVYRIDANGKETALPAVAVFPGFKRAATDTCEKFPIQKFYWKDVYARLVAEKTGERAYRYKIVPLTGEPGSLAPMHIPQVISNEVEISARISDTMHAYFNRGLISTQRISRALQGNPSKKGLLDHIENPTDTLRASLSGDMVEALTDFVARAKSGGKLYAALYELHDQELVPLLEKAGTKLSIVLSNAMQQEVRPMGAPTVEEDGNPDARDRLTKTASAMFSRLLPNNQIGHNKFVVYVDKTGHPRAVLFGSTNWTPTGLCAQTNNTVVLDNAKVAQRYLDYWKQLKADTQQAKTDAKALQGATLRTWDGGSKDISLGADGKLRSWFSPNTPKLRSSSTKNEKRPPDMADVVKAIEEAKRAVLFLLFYPGSPNVAQWAADAQRANKDLFVRGCVTNPSASESFYYEL
ncbi:MAG TPA: phospholipase D-like domain-containing protein, partial [Vicinamibacteria bacterium]|nr:phospholipase D-like domain-containing protein [Vicinamibacteria bacterium]